MHADRHEFSCLYYVLVRYWHSSIQSCPIKCQTFICYRCMCRFSCSQFSSARITLLYHREAVYNWPYPRLSHCMMFTATKPYKQSCSVPTTTTSCHCKPCELVAVRGTQPNLLQEGGYHTVWCFTLGCHTIWCLQPLNLTSKAAVSLTTTSCHCKPCELVGVRGTQPLNMPGRPRGRCTVRLRCDPATIRCRHAHLLLPGFDSSRCCHSLQPI